MRAPGVNDDISVLIVAARRFDPNSLMPAVHATHRIRVDRKGQVLMNSALLPENALRIGIIALEWFDAFTPPQPPSAFAKLFHLDQRGCPAVGPLFLFQPPAPQVM
jgi:hypothetical protein